MMKLSSIGNTVCLRVDRGTVLIFQWLYDLKKKTMRPKQAQEIEFLKF